MRTNVAEKPAVWIEKKSELLKFLSNVDSLIAVDTESDHMYSYSPRVCLLQLSHESATALFDVMQFDRDGLLPLIELFGDENVIKVMHSGHNDINELDRDFHISIKGFYDTQVAARFLGESGASLEWLLENYFGVKADKKYQRFNWSCRPIPENARRYAAMDVDYLIDARSYQLKKLEEKNWLVPCLELCDYIAASTHFHPTPFDENGWRKFPDIKKTTPQARKIIKDIYLLRHLFCLDHNLPSHNMASARAIVNIGMAHPRSLEALGNIRGTSPKFIDACGEEILKIVSDGLAGDGIEFPCNKGGYNENFVEVCKADLARLKSWRNTTATNLGIPKHYLFSNSVLTDIITTNPKTTEELAAVNGVLNWQVNRFGEKLLSILHAKTD